MCKTHPIFYEKYCYDKMDLRPFYFNVTICKLSHTVTKWSPSHYQNHSKTLKEGLKMIFLKQS